jgi:phage portal protein BeeE
LTKAERKLGYYARFNFDELLRGDAKTRAEVNHIRRQDGVITANEWRAMDDMNPRDEAEADKLVINGNMREIGVVNQPLSGSLPTGGEKI